MTTTINGRTPEEIKKGLECCAYVNAPCEGCPFRTDIICECIQHMSKCALTYIQQLERERDAAVKQLKDVDTVDLFCCSHCKHEELCDYNLNSCDDCEKDCPCHTCVDMCNWQWRGVEGGE